MEFQRAFLERWEPEIWVSEESIRVPQAAAQCEFSPSTLQQHNHTPE